MLRNLGPVFRFQFFYDREESNTSFRLIDQEPEYGIEVCRVLAFDQAELRVLSLFLFAKICWIGI